MAGQAAPSYYNGWDPDGNWIQSADTTNFAPGGVTNAFGQNGNMMYDGFDTGAGSAGNPVSGIGGAGSASDSIFSQNSMFGGSTKDALGNVTKSGGWVSPLTSMVGTGVNAYMGMKNLGLAEDELDFKKDSWERNFAMMQDQYYRKLNNRRANAAMASGADWKESMDFYDSGQNLDGGYTGAMNPNDNPFPGGSVQVSAPEYAQGTEGSAIPAGGPTNDALATPAAQATGSGFIMPGYSTTQAPALGGTFNQSGSMNQQYMSPSDSRMGAIANSDGSVSPTNVDQRGNVRRKPKNKKKEKQGSDNTTQNATGAQ